MLGRQTGRRIKGVGPGAFASCFPDWLPEKQRVFQLPKNMDAGHHAPQTAFEEMRTQATFDETSLHTTGLLASFDIDDYRVHQELSKPERIHLVVLFTTLH